MPDALAELRALVTEPSAPPVAHSPLDELRSLIATPDRAAVDANPTPDELDVIKGAPPNRPAFSLKPPVAPPAPGFEPTRTFTRGRFTGLPGQDITSATPNPMVDPVLEGVPQAGRGVKHLVTGEGGRMNAASDVIEGAMRASTPAIVATGIVNPIETLAALVAGYGGQTVASSGVAAVGGSPEAARLAGNVGGLVVGGAAAHGAGVGKARLMDALRPKVEPSVVPTESVSPVSAKPEVAASPIEELQQIVEPAAPAPTAEPVTAPVEVTAHANPIEELQTLVGDDHAVQEPVAAEGGVLGGVRPEDEGGRADLGARDAEHQEPAVARGEAETPVGAEAAAGAEPAEAAPVGSPRSADLSEDHLKEVRRIVHELDAMGYTDTTWTDRTQEPGVNDGNAGGGQYERRPRVAGAKVYDDIYQMAPGNSKATRAAVQDQLERYLAGGKPTNAVKGAIEIARLRMEGKARIPGDGKLSSPELPPSAGEVPTRLEAKPSLAEEASPNISEDVLEPATDEGDVDSLGDWFKQQAEAERPAAAEASNPIEELARLINEQPKVAEAPFSLEREAAESNEVQPDLFKPEKPKFGEWQKAQAPKGDVTLQSTLVPGAKEFAEQSLEPLARGAKDVVREARDTLSPQTASPEAQASADVVRGAKARIANANAIEESKYAKVAKGFAKGSDAQNIANISAYERTGQFEHAPAGYSEFYTKSMTQAGRLLEQAYGRNVVGRVQNYVRRAFVFGTKADEQRGVDYLTHKMYSLSANKSPLKHRVLDMPLDEALANMKDRGISVKPVTTNPELLRQWSLGNARQAVAYRQAWDELSARRLVRYVASFKKPPKGMVPLEDRVATRFKSPLIGVSEARDAGVMEGLRDVASDLGVTLERKVNIGGPRSAVGGTVWGYSEQGGNRVATKFAGSESILAHEIGHQIDHKFGLWDKLQDLEKQYKAQGYENWSLQKQLRAVTDLTWEGQPEPSDTYQRYNRSKEEKIANLISAYVHAPEKLHNVAPDVFNVLDELVDTTPQLQGLREIKPGIRLEPGEGEVHAGGHVIAGQYYADPTVARVLNNAISRGLENSPTYRGLRAINSSMNQLQLGLSGFHATGTAINAGIGDLALGVRKMARGDVAGGAASIGRSLVPGASFARDLFKGDQLIRGLKANNPEAYQVLNEKVNPSGARLHIEERYQNRAYEKMRTSFANSDYIRAGLRLPLAVVEQTAKPLMSFAIPRVKIGALLDMLHDIDARMPDASPEEKTRAYAAASDSIDNRFGQLVHDNLFWNKTASDLSQIATRSVGWNLGTVREIGGGVADTRKLAHGEVTDRLLYTAALPVYVGMIGAVYQYLHTGEKPSEAKDYFYPKNGRTEPNGMVSRTTLPTYMKDVAAYTSAPGATVMHKQSPLLEFGRSLYENEDYFGNLIRNPDDPISKQAQQLGSYALREVAPFSVQQLQRANAEKATPEGKAESFLGFVKAPASMERTPAETMMHDFIGPQPGRTPEQVEKSGVKRELREDIKAGDTAAARAIVDKGQLGRRSVMDAARSAHLTGIQSGFKKLTLDQALRVYDVATPEQRGALRTLLGKKVTALRDAAPEDLPELQKRLLRAGQLPFSPPPIMAALQPPP